ncbi:OmpA family protein [Falsihalocynthiibacter sp. S25ZX9]|uniref:OmpA family protein n=1 Tax=Falsihalocynthiibacter sp. S25ZX9 TaxID=3240870 RepID=UPI00350FB7B4
MIHTKSKLLLASAAVLALASCTDPGYVTGESQSKTKDGAIIGGLLGGFIGATSGSPKNAALGAAAGAIVGTAIGSALDQQKKDLDASFTNSAIDVVNTGTELIVVMPQGILFDSDSSTVKSSLDGEIRALATNLQNYPKSTVTIYGHTDNTGTAEHNLLLSQRRADAVMAKILSAGVSGGRVSAVGKGEDSPVASNLTEEGKAANRRVEIVIHPTN